MMIFVIEFVYSPQGEQLNINTTVDLNNTYNMLEFGKTVWSYI